MDWNQYPLERNIDQCSWLWKNQTRSEVMFQREGLRNERERKVDNRMVWVQDVLGRTDVYVLDAMTGVGEDKIENISFGVGWLINWDRLKLKMKSQNDIEWWEDEERVDQCISGILKSPSKMVSLQWEDTRSDKWVIRLELSGLGETYVQHSARGMWRWRSRETISRWSGLEIIVARILFFVAINTPRDLRSLQWII